jgi:hypothetical protein
MGARGGAGRAGPGRGARALAARIAALEDRVARLETGRPAPGDGRRAAVKTKAVRRCPGCGLPLRRLRGRCAGCGRPLDAG